MWRIDIFDVFSWLWSRWAELSPRAEEVSGFSTREGSGLVPDG